MFVLQFAVQNCLYLVGFWSDFEFSKTHMSPHVSWACPAMSWACPGHIQVMSETPSNSLLMRFFFLLKFFFQNFFFFLLKMDLEPSTKASGCLKNPKFLIFFVPMGSGVSGIDTSNN